MLQNDNVVYSFTGPMGVRIDIGQSIIFLIGLILFLNLGSSLVNGAIFVTMLFVSILLHELGHAWGCKVQGIPVQRILMHGGGGLCFPGRTGTPREQELIVIMGPLVNLALWAMSGVLQYLVLRYALANPGSPQGDVVMFQIINYVGLFGWLNLLLFVFNLIPVQPLDGGKMFHLLMLRLTNPRKAVQITGAVGLAAAVLWIPAAIFAYVSFGFILFFFPSIPLHFAMMQGRAAF
ncbi:Zn-dependent protease (includes SpoIVFB) [Cognatiyoonia koreensis]|uniref:Zn-dependent protease (Includes SpoIVFB) n=1 Tax=Cognatiyoonia koreensis TaxID=364200 RepID=A0A1I0N5G5_9RHOB|nr:site-2 protease family protein [Cognatiyoonia koreensis]SEV95995.1 Zn-dependent protease (includes SpoIVFB) [Cognatiyoonia koreensis]